MALRFVYTFTGLRSDFSSNDIVTVTFNNATDLYQVSAINYETGDPITPDGSYLDMTPSYNGLFIKSICGSGSYLGSEFIIKGINTFPFAYTDSVVPDSPYCSSSGGCNITLGVTGNDEVSSGGNNGTITASATSTYGGIEYRLDSGAWQSSGEFNGLAPATYNIQARDSNGCLDDQDYTINAYVETTYAVKYRLEYKNYFDEACRVDIIQDSYVGDIIPIIGIENQACVIRYDVGDDPYDPIANSMAEIGFFNQGQVDLQELRNAGDRDFRVRFYINGAVKWIGFVVPDGITQELRAFPYDVTITATDGLKLLDGLDYSHNNLTGGRCILNYYRQILFADSNLGLPLPIRWVNTLECDEYPGEDMLSGSVEWAPTGEGFTDYNGNTKSGLYILEEMTRSMQSRLYQSNGYWVIERINDVAEGSYYYKETPASLAGMVVTTGFLEVLKSIGRAGGAFSYSFIEENQNLRTAKALGTVITTYEQDQRDNILPNGSMDLYSFGSPLYWGMSSGSSALVTGGEPSLSEARGYSVKVDNTFGADAYFQLQGGLALPIDTDVLYDSINFGFKYSVQSGALDITIRLTYLQGSASYFLNEFGYWTTTITDVTISVDSLAIGDVATVDFNKRQDIILPLPADIPIERTTHPALAVLIKIPAGAVIFFDDIYLNVDRNSDVVKATFEPLSKLGKEEHTMKISSSHNGFFVSNYMTNFDKPGLEKFYSDSIASGLTLTAMNSQAILRNKYKPSNLFEGSIYGNGWSYGEVYSIEGLTDQKLLPLGCSWNTETCTIDLNAIESRNDDIAISLEYYGSNDNERTLSN